ncbi:MAG TPA: cellulose binding domain-containing protein [Cellvibrio sp.]|nr:cellulose binding domain-containing protein [Cellvibrio sp.]
MKLLSGWAKPLVVSCCALGLGLYGGAAAAAKCEYVVANEWGSGFTASIRITNDGTAPVSGWALSWSYSDGSRVTSSWNATLTGTNPYSAGPVGWNSNIAVGSSVEFGVQGTNGGSKAQIPVVSGSVCSGTVASSAAPASSTPKSSTPASSLRSSTAISVATSVRSSTATSTSGQMCNWYGTLTPLCATTASGWGYENGRSCVATATCSAQPAPYGIVGSNSSLGSSSVRSSIRSSVASSLEVTSSRASSSRGSSSVGTSSAASSIPPIVGGCDGYATRYWDCCKPHCGWSGNVPSLVAPLQSCAANNTRLGDLTLPSSCDGGNAHMCWGMAPFAVSDTLAYGFAATSSGDVCGRCYQLQFTGASHNSPGDPGSAALLGKTMIVQATNIGYDVGGGQFDILVPGGGVGAFNACSAQWGVSNSELGAQYGGLLAACKQELGYNASLAQYKSCLINRCNSVFGSRGLTELQRACTWYADWFQAADNPALKYKEVACPAELTSRSGMNRGALNDIKTSCN